ncbi:hypothetical protein [Pantanalinema sp. GBBB05]|uniref:hypothetical protein n=1 Tax=Pantanalinema sp. GBBB05 TaxID=2604139 RepID=UPI001D974F61|nr:hypothetical protein [Pantanalinema sp. GBBB05]
MFSSPSGIYRSKVLGAILRQTRRWSDRGKVALRRVQVAASWSAQILLYPIYALFQTSRVIGAQVYQTVQLGVSGLRPTSTPIAADSISDPALPPITVDTPISTVLQTIQEFALPIGVPVFLEGADAITPIRPTTSTIQHTIFPLTVDGSGIAIPGSPVFIQGIATLLDTGAVVLITNQNQILDILTSDQQARLQYRITWEVASYGRSVNLRKMVANLPLPRLNFALNASSDAPGIVDRMTQGLSALSRQVFRTAESVGNEVYRFVRSGLFGRSLAMPESQALPGMALWTATVDTPLEKALQTVQQFPLPMHLLASLLEPVSGHRELAALNDANGQHSLLHAACSQAAPLPVLTIPPELAALPDLYVRGVASRLDTQAIVLVTNQNQTLDLLSPEQQEHIRQRIIWSVAHFYRYQQIRRSVSRSFSRLRPPEQQVLLPIRGFYQLMAWVQSGSVAIATNLFQEARLAARRFWAAESALLDIPIPSWAYAHPSETAGLPLPTSSTAPRRLAPSWLDAINQRYTAWCNSRAVQTAIALVQTQVTALLPPARPQRDTSSAMNRQITDPSQLVEQPPAYTGLEFGSTARQSLFSWQESTLALANSAADIWDSYAPQPQTSSPVATVVPTVTPQSPTDRITPTMPDYIDIQATLLGYLYSPLERLLQWLDRWLLWCEDAVIRVWRWWQQVWRHDDRPSE